MKVPTEKRISNAGISIFRYEMLQLLKILSKKSDPFSWKNVDFFGNVHFLSRKSKDTETVLLAREQAHSLLFKTPELFDNGQLLVILERI